MCNNKPKKFFEFLKDFKTDENITFSEFLNLLHLDEETYILSCLYAWPHT
jgi:hypothetical protein